MDIRVSFRQVFFQLGDSKTAMTNAVFYLQRHFSKTDGETVGHENGVISESFSVGMSLGENLTVHTSFKIFFFAILY